MVMINARDMHNGFRQRRAVALIGTLIGAFGTSAAHAGYYVETYANTGRGYDRGCAATYNSIGTGAKFVLNDGSNAPCGPTATFNGETVTVTGSTDTTGKLTSAHDESTVTSPPDYAAATSVADLKTGKVHLYATATGFSSATAQAELNDTLHFTIAGATANTVTLIPVRFAFDGTLSGGGNGSTADLLWGFSFGNASAAEFGDYGAAYYNPPRYPTFAFPEATPSRVSGWQSYSFASYTPTDTRFTGVYAITGATADIPVDFRLTIDSDNATLDYTHTGSVSLGHVAGVSFTSDSGVFLTGAGGAVPEPASWALLVAGFGVVGITARRRRSVVAA